MTMNMLNRAEAVLCSQDIEDLRRAFTRQWVVEPLTSFAIDRRVMWKPTRDPDIWICDDGRLSLTGDGVKLVLPPPSSELWRIAEARRAIRQLEWMQS